MRLAGLNRLYSCMLKLNAQIRIHIFILSITLSFFIFPFIFLGFDFIHESVNIGSALALDNAIPVHKDAFEMKGLLYPVYLNLFLFKTSVLLMKVANALLIALSSFLIYVIISPKNRILGLFSALLWLLSGPSLSNFTYGKLHGVLLISPNNLTVTLILFNILLMTSWHAHNGQKVTWKLVFIAIVSGLLPWVRIQNIVFSVLIFATVIYNLKKKEGKVAFFVFAYLSTMFFPLFYLLRASSISEWYKQVLLYPFQLSKIQDLATYTSPSNILKTLSICILYFLFFLVSMLAKRLSKLLTYFVFFIILLSAPLSKVISAKALIDPSKDLDFRNWVVILANNWPVSWSRALVIVILFVLSANFGLIVYRLTKVFRRSNKLGSVLLSTIAIDSSKVPHLLAGLQGLLFLYPNFGNLWEMTPLLLVSLSVYLPKLTNDARRALSFISLPLVLSFLLSSSYTFLTISRLPHFYYSNTLLKGIYEVERLKVDGLDRVMSTLNETTGGILNECAMSIFVFPDGTFRSANRYMTNLSFRQFVESDSIVPNVVIKCSDEYSDFNTTHYSLIKLIQLDSGKKVSIFMRHK